MTTQKLLLLAWKFSSKRTAERCLKGPVLEVGQLGKFKMCLASLLPIILKGLRCIHYPSLAALTVMVHSQISMQREAKSAGFQYPKGLSSPLWCISDPKVSSYPSPAEPGCSSPSTLKPTRREAIHTHVQTDLSRMSGSRSLVQVFFVLHHY